MRSKIGIKLTRNYSLNFNPKKRGVKKIKFIIIHYTGMKRESDAIEKLCNSKSKVSSHYYIKKNGEILSLVPDLYEAWHAGKSKWKNFKSLNKYSLGIEITNRGHQHGYQNFSIQQIKSLKKLLRYLINLYNINLKYILGHSDISPDRKKDPGEKFPWKNLAKNKLCWWHKLHKDKLKKLRNINLSSNKEKVSFIKNLHQIGYNRITKKMSNSQIRFLVKSFQRRFRQEIINGKIDKECLIISENLVNQNKVL